MTWAVEIGDEFLAEFNELDEDVHDEILALARLLQRAAIGAAPCGLAEWLAPRQHEGTAVQRRGGEWRVAFAFDTRRRAILLVAGDKSGVSGKTVYRRLIRKADERFDAHLARLKDRQRRRDGD